MLVCFLEFSINTPLSYRLVLSLFRCSTYYNAFVDIQKSLTMLWTINKPRRSNFCTFR